MAIHPLTKIGDSLAVVAGQLERVADRSAFVQTSRVVHTFANQALYSVIDVSSACATIQDHPSHSRVDLLLRTLQANTHLAESVRRFKIDLIPLDTVTQLIKFSTSLRTLIWHVENSEPTYIPDVLFVPAPLPPVPTYIRHLTVHKFLRLPFWPHTLSDCLALASGIRILSLITTLPTMSEIFQALGPQIQDLKVEHIMHGGSRPYEAIPTIFMPLTNLKRLRLSEYGPWHCRELTLPASLQRLILDTARLNDMRAICERLCNSDWCPNMQRLPLVKHPFVSMELLSNGSEDQLHGFLSTCERAKAACKGRPTWLESPEDFDRWTRRVLPDCGSPQQ